jgi:SulP family sulfate permease
MRDSSRFTQVRDITDNDRYVRTALPESWRVYKLVGALFFAAAERVFTEILSLAGDGDTLVLYADGVTVLDAGGTGALERFLDECNARDIKVVIADLQEQPLKALAGCSSGDGFSRLTVTTTLDEALSPVAG